MKVRHRMEREELSAIAITSSDDCKSYQDSGNYPIESKELMEDCKKKID